MKKAGKLLVSALAIMSTNLAFLAAASLRGFLIAELGMTRILAQLLSIIGAFLAVFLAHLIFYKISYKQFNKGENHDN